MTVLSPFYCRRVDGASPRRFLRFLGLTAASPLRVVVSPLRGDEFYNSAPRNGKPYNRACGALEMHPYPRLQRYFHLKVKRLTTFCASLTLLQNVFAVHPGGGKFALLSTSELISISRHKGTKTSPSGGGAVGRRGAFLSPVRAVGLFSSGRSPVVWFSLHCCHKLKLTPLPSTHSAP